MSVFDSPSDVLPDQASSPEEIARFVVEAAINAPSVNNTQPWWFYGIDREIGMHADTERSLPVADPDGREMMISCGAALFTARVALRYLGVVPKVRVLPEQDLPTLVAKINWSESVPAVGYERELFAAVPRRHTHRGGFGPEPLPAGALAALQIEAAKEGAKLLVLAGEDQRDALAAVVEAGDYALRHDEARAREQAHWGTGPGSRRRDGVPPSAYPARQARIEPNFPARDFAHGHDWGLPPDSGDHLARSAGIVTVLTTSSDRPHDWISAGQALQRVLLFAASSGLAAALHSQPLEVPQLRDFSKVHLCDGAYPQMVLRFGAAGQTGASVRRPVQDVLL